MPRIDTRLAQFVDGCLCLVSSWKQEIKSSFHGDLPFIIPVDAVDLGSPCIRRERYRVVPRPRSHNGLTACRMALAPAPRAGASLPLVPVDAVFFGIVDDGVDAAVKTC